MKRCSHCGRILPVTEFRKHKGTKDGLQYACKECQVEMTTAAKQKRTENKKEVIKEAQKEALKVKLISEFPETDRGQLDEAIKAVKELKKEMEKTQTIIGNATDEQLVEELRRRGYQGNLIKKTSFIL